MKNALDKILDPENDENIVLYNSQNEPIEFRQIAVIPYDMDIYLILQPIVMPDGANSDEALVFIIEDYDEEGFNINLVIDDKMIDIIFDEYYKLLADE